jgi:hypothetical protein
MIRHLLHRLFHRRCIVAFALVALSASALQACPVQVGAVIAQPAFVGGYSQGFQSVATVATAAPCACATQQAAAVVAPQAVESYAAPQVVQSYAQPLVVAQPLAVAVPFYSFSAFATPFYGYASNNVFVGSSRGRFFGGRQVSRQRVAVTTTRTRTVIRGR